MPRFELFEPTREQRSLVASSDVDSEARCLATRGRMMTMTSRGRAATTGALLTSMGALAVPQLARSPEEGNPEGTGGGGGPGGAFPPSPPPAHR